MKQQLSINKRAKKSLGQNFIKDENFLLKLSDFIETDNNTIILEIGPGKGALTSHLVKKKFKQLILIEKDNNLCQKLIQVYRHNKKIKIQNIDALEFPYSEFNLKNNVIIVGNLPFNISSQLLFKWLEVDAWPPFYKRMILMFQKEVADRVVSNHNCKSYGRISVAAQARCHIKKILNAPPSIFTPVPKVFGTVLDFRPSNKYKDINFTELQTILKLAFAKRRKKLKNNLIEYSDKLIKLKIDENLRAENLSIEDYCKLAGT